MYRPSVLSLSCANAVPEASKNAAPIMTRNVFIERSLSCGGEATHWAAIYKAERKRPWRRIGLRSHGSGCVFAEGSAGWGSHDCCALDNGRTATLDKRRLSLGFRRRGAVTSKRDRCAMPGRFVQGGSNERQRD